MKDYYLYLDESGSFEPQGTPNLGRASIVAGYLTEKTMSESEAFSLFREVQESDAKYARIDINRFHGMEIRHPAFGEFLGDALRAMVERGMKIVVFGEGRHHYIVNSDRTYLNILADGVVKLAMELLAQTDDEIRLHVLYAWRKEMSGNVLGNQQQMIDKKEYERRIGERIELGKSQLSQASRKRLKRIETEEGSARKLHRLMLADLVCTGLRGGRQKLDAATRAYLAEQKNSILVLEDGAMEQMRRLFIENRIADAVFSWYLIHEEGRSEADSKKFHDLLAANLRGMNAKSRELQYDMLMDAMGTLINSRQFVQAQRLSARLEEDFFPFLQEIGCSSQKFCFNKHFYDLTRHTHQGDTAASQREIELCNKILDQMPLTLESAWFCTDYRIREIEHLKNIYAYEEAWEKLQVLEKGLLDTLSILPIVHPLGASEEELKSDLLGKVLSSKVQVYSLMMQRGERDCLEEGRTASQNAFLYFSQEWDKKRHAQSRAALEYWGGDHDEARHFLARSVDLPEGAPFSSILQRMTGESPNLFGLMHYAKWMRLAFRDGYEYAGEMLRAWQETGVEDWLNERDGDHIRGEEYPGCVIHWDVAAVEARQGKHRDTPFLAAIRDMLKKEKDFTLYFMGLAAAADRLTFIDGKNWDRDAKELRASVSLLPEEEMPETMRILARKWKDGMERLSGLPREEKKSILKSLARATPVL